MRYTQFSYLGTFLRNSTLQNNSNANIVSIEKESFSYIDVNLHLKNKLIGKS